MLLHKNKKLTSERRYTDEIKTNIPSSWITVHINHRKDGNTGDKSWHTFIQILQYIHNNSHLNHISSAMSTIILFFFATNNIDKRIGTKHWPLKILLFVTFPFHRWSVQDLVEIECWIWKGTYWRMHPVLHVKKVLWMTKWTQPFKQASSKSSFNTDLLTQHMYQCMERDTKKVVEKKK